MAYQKRTNVQINGLLAEAENKKTCLHSLNPLERAALSRRCADEFVCEPYRGMYIRCKYWNGLFVQDQARHVIRALSNMHDSWVFSHASSALIHQLEVPREIAWPIHYATEKKSTSTGNKRLVHHHSGGLATLQKDGVNINSIEQTVVDCAAEYPFQLALPIADSALHQGLTTKERLTNCLSNRANKRGIRKAARVITAADSRPENGGESRVRAIMIEEGLPEPELQAKVENPEAPGHYFYIDFLFTRPDGEKVAMELDGQEKYVNATMTAGRNTAQVMMAERQREATITSMGIRVARFSYGQAINPSFLKTRLAHYGIEPIR